MDVVILVNKIITQDKVYSIEKSIQTMKMSLMESKSLINRQKLKAARHNEAWK